VRIRRQLKLMLGIEIILIIVHKFYTNHSLSDSANFIEWHYLLALSFGIFIIIYTLRIKCPKCGARQVFRGFSVWDMRMPQDECYKCGHCLIKK